MAQRDDTTIGFTYVDEKKLAGVVRLSCVELKFVVSKWSYIVNTPPRPPRKELTARAAHDV